MHKWNTAVRNGFTTETPPKRFPFTDPAVKTYSPLSTDYAAGTDTVGAVEDFRRQSLPESPATPPLQESSSPLGTISESRTSQPHASSGFIAAKDHNGFRTIKTDSYTYSYTLRSMGSTTSPLPIQPRTSQVQNRHVTHTTTLKCLQTTSSNTSMGTSPLRDLAFGLSSVGMPSTILNKPVGTAARSETKAGPTTTPFRLSMSCSPIANRQSTTCFKRAHDPFQVNLRHSQWPITGSPEQSPSDSSNSSSFSSPSSPLMNEQSRSHFLLESGFTSPHPFFHNLKENSLTKCYPDDQNGGENMSPDLTPSNGAGTIANDGSSVTEEKGSRVMKAGKPLSSPFDGFMNKSGPTVSINNESDFTATEELSRNFSPVGTDPGRDAVETISLNRSGWSTGTAFSSNGKVLPFRTFSLDSSQKASTRATIGHIQSFVAGDLQKSGASNAYGYRLRDSQSGLFYTSQRGDGASSITNNTYVTATAAVQALVDIPQGTLSPRFYGATNSLDSNKITYSTSFRSSVIDSNVGTRKPFSKRSEQEIPKTTEVPCRLVSDHRLPAVVENLGLSNFTNGNKTPPVHELNFDVQTGGWNHDQPERIINNDGGRVTILPPSPLESPRRTIVPPAREENRLYSEIDSVDILQLLLSMLSVSCPSVSGMPPPEGGELPFIFQLAAIIQRINGDPSYSAALGAKLAKGLCVVISCPKGDQIIQELDRNVRMRNSYLVYEAIAIGMLDLESDSLLPPSIRAPSCFGTFLTPNTIKQWMLPFTAYERVPRPDQTLSLVSNFLREHRTSMVCRLLKALDGVPNYNGHMPHVTKILEFLILIGPDPTIATLASFLVASRAYFRILSKLTARNPSMTDLLLTILGANPPMCLPITHRMLEELDRQVVRSINVKLKKSASFQFLPDGGMKSFETDDSSDSLSAGTISSRRSSMLDADVALTNDDPFRPNYDISLHGEEDASSSMNMSSINFFRALSLTIRNLIKKVSDLASKSSSVRHRKRFHKNKRSRPPILHTVHNIECKESNPARADDSPSTATDPATPSLKRRHNHKEEDEDFADLSSDDLFSAWSLSIDMSNVHESRDLYCRKRRKHPYSVTNNLDHIADVESDLINPIKISVDSDSNLREFAHTGHGCILSQADFWVKREQARTFGLSDLHYRSLLPITRLNLTGDKPLRLWTEDDCLANINHSSITILNNQNYNVEEAYASHDYELEEENSPIPAFEGQVAIESDECALRGESANQISSPVMKEYNKHDLPNSRVKRISGKVKKRRHIIRLKRQKTRRVSHLELSLDKAMCRLVEVSDFISRLIEGTLMMLSASSQQMGIPILEVDGESPLMFNSHDTFRHPQVRLLNKVILSSPLIGVLSQGIPCHMWRRSKTNAKKRQGVSHISKGRGFRFHTRVCRPKQWKRRWLLPLHLTESMLTAIGKIARGICKSPALFAGFSWRVHAQLVTILPDLASFVSDTAWLLRHSRGRKSSIKWFDGQYVTRHQVQVVLENCLWIIANILEESPVQVYTQLNNKFWTVLGNILVDSNVQNVSMVRVCSILKQVILKAPGDVLVTILFRNDILWKISWCLWYNICYNGVVITASKDSTVATILDLAIVISNELEARLLPSIDSGQAWSIEDSGRKQLPRIVKSIIEENWYWTFLQPRLQIEAERRETEPFSMNCMAPLEQTKRLRDFRKMEEKTARQRRADGFGPWKC